WRPAARCRQRPEPISVQALLALLPRSGAPEPARPCPTPPRPQSLDSQLDQTLEASLSPPCTRGLTASPRRRPIAGGQRTRLTPTLAFAPSNAPFQARRRGS